MQTQIKVEDGYYVIRIPVADSYDDWLAREFVAGLKVREIVSRSQATEDQINELADELQENWWRENKDRFLNGPSH